METPAGDEPAGAEGNTDASRSLPRTPRRVQVRRRVERRRGAGRVTDFAEINAAALAAYPGLLERWFPEGRLRGREFLVGDIGGSPGTSCSINVQTGKWADFAAGLQGGDPISLYAAMRNLKQGEAARELGEQLGAGLPSPAPRQNGAKPKNEAPPKVVLPVPADAPPPTFRHRLHGTPSRTWPYPDAMGRSLGWVCRFDKAAGHKEILPYCYTTDGWRWVSFPKPRPLYGLDQLAKAPAANVVVVEGEKAADAARTLFPQAVVVTWPGGANAVKHADWTPLAGRKVVIWPDADEPGRKAAIEIARALDLLGCEVRLVDVFGIAS